VTSTAGAATAVPRMLVPMLLLALFLASCAPLVTTPAPPAFDDVAVLPAHNRTGDELFIDPPPILARVLGADPGPRATVTDLLTAEARAHLERRGFRVAPPHAAGGAGPAPRDASDAARIAAAAGWDGPVLYIEVKRWEPDVHSRPSYVTAALDLVLVDADGGAVLWEAHWPARAVPAGSTGTVALGYPLAARRLIADMTAELETSPLSSGTSPGDELSRSAPPPLAATEDSEVPT
jgi:hypothetical protein